MTRPDDAELIAFLEGRLQEPARRRVLDALEQDPTLAREIQSAAIGMSAAESLGLARPAAPHSPSPSSTAHPRRVSPWWVVVATAASLLLALPLASWWANVQRGAANNVTAGPAAETALPEPGFAMVLHGRWPDMATVGADETERRADEYWAWTDSLAHASVLIAAGDFRFEEGMRLLPNGTQMAQGAAVAESPDYVVGILALRVSSYEEALAISRECPHLRYGGSVSVRRLGRGFLTTSATPSSATPLRRGAAGELRHAPVGSNILAVSGPAVHLR